MILELNDDEAHEAEMAVLRQLDDLRNKLYVLGLPFADNMDGGVLVRGRAVERAEFRRRIVALEALNARLQGRQVRKLTDEQGYDILNAVRERINGFYLDDHYTPQLIVKEIHEMTAPRLQGQRQEDER
jgi:hypothetical protein